MSSRQFVIPALAFFLMVTPVMAVTTVNELRAESAASRAAAKDAMKEKREEARTAAKERWEELKNTREASREAKRAEVRAAIEAKREEIKAKVTAMKDERKKKIVERVQEKLGNVNERRTEHFQKVLERLSTILDKITSRTEKAKADGKNVTGIETSILAARSAITTAETAVAAQKEKTYQVTVTDDTTAKNDVGTVTKQLESDLQSVHQTVQAAKNAVQKVYSEIKAVVGSNKSVTPTSTGSSDMQ